MTFCYNQQIFLKDKLISKYQNLEYEYYLSKNSSEYQYNLNVLLGKFTNGLLFNLIKLFGDIIILFSIITLLLLINPALTFIASILLLFILFSYDLIFKKKLNLMGESINKLSTRFMKNTNSLVDGFKTIRLLSKENYFRKIVLDDTKKYSKTIVNFHIISILPRYFFETLLITTLVIIILFYKYFFNDNVIFFSTFTVFGLAVLRVLPAITSIASSISSIRYNKDTLNIISKIINEKNINNNINEINNNQSLLDKFKKIKLKDVSFNYQNTENKILDNINLEINKGEIIGIQGESGAGKTTFIEILLGLLTPTSGKVLIDDIDINCNIKDYQNGIDYLPQNGFLLDDTIEKNIALADDIINQDRLMKAVDFAQLQYLIDKNFDGIKTIIGEKGNKISGGEKQKILLARSFYLDKKIIILDEPTSSLDFNYEKQLNNILKNFSKQKTIIIISHKKEILKLCSKVYNFKNNSIL